MDLNQDDWHTCFLASQDVYIDTGFLLDDDHEAPYVIFKWTDLVKMIQTRHGRWGEGILLESSLVSSHSLDKYVMKAWLEWWACRYLRAGKIYDVLVSGDSNGVVPDGEP